MLIWNISFQCDFVFICLIEMIWYKLRLTLSALCFIVILLAIDSVFENFENSLMRNVTSKNEEKNTAFSFCTSFVNIYMNCPDFNNQKKYSICNNLSAYDCNRVLFEATQTSYSLFNLTKQCNLMTLLNVDHNSSYTVYINFGMVCHLFSQKTEEKLNKFLIRFNNLNKFQTLRVYIYIHEHSIIPEYFNHYVHVFDTNIYGYLSISFTKKIIYRHLTGRYCKNYGGEYKSRDHCSQSCERKYFNYNYYMFLYLENDNVSVFSSSRNQLHPYCFDSCANRCITYFFEVVSLKDQKNLESNHSVDDDETDETHDVDMRVQSASFLDFVNDGNSSDFLEIFLFRSQTQDTIHNLFLNRGILYVNIFTIESIITGFNFFLIVNFVSIYLKHFNSSLLNLIRTINLDQLLIHIMKICVFLGFLYHVVHLLKEIDKSKYFETLVLKKNSIVENITITFCFNLSNLIDTDKYGDLVSNGQSLDYKKLYLHPELSDSIQVLIEKIFIYSRNYFKDKKVLDNYLNSNSELLFYEVFKCWKINFDFVAITSLIMNSNVIKFTTLDNNIKFKFTKPYDQVYLSEYNLYPFSYSSFENRRFFKKSIKTFDEEFERTGACLDYRLVEKKRCRSRGECIRECRLISILKRHNFYMTNYKYIPRYKNELNISEETNFAYANQTVLSAELNNTCSSKFKLPDCRKVEYKYKDFRPENDYQSSSYEFVLDLNFDESSEEINYSFRNVEIVIYLTNLCFVYFGVSVSGLFSLFKQTNLKKLDSMKLIFIGAIIYLEYRELIGLYLNNRLIYDIEFDTTDSMNIPKVTACFKIEDILKTNQTDLPDDQVFAVSKEKEEKDYYLHLDDKNKDMIQSTTKNLSELFDSISFLANDFGTYTNLQKQRLSSLERLGNFNSLTVSTSLFHNSKCYTFELKFKAPSNEIFDLDYVIRFQPKDNPIFFHIYKQKFLTTKDLVRINSSRLIKFTPFIVINKSFEDDCETKTNEKYLKQINSIRRRFFEGYNCVTTFLAVTKEFKNVSICNRNFQSVEDEIIKSFSFKEEACLCCRYHTYKITYLNSQKFTIIFSHSGYKFLKVYRLKLTYIELITYLISIPSLLLGINLFKLIKIFWINFLN